MKNSNRQQFSGSLKSVLAISAVLSLSACGSFWAIGETELSCDAETGMGCTNIRAAYVATDNYSPETDAKNHWVKKSKSKDKHSQGKAAEYGYGVNTDGIADFEPMIPEVIPTVAGQGQIVKPMREQEQIMRVWVNAHQDQDGNLIYPSHTFTQVKQPKWAVGTPHKVPKTKTILPPQAGKVSGSPNSAQSSAKEAFDSFEQQGQVRANGSNLDLNANPSAPLAD
ncbi:MAG: TraV family lipoprotein [Neisseriaceae bacterium]|nr:TraV family lipoprotein [Neisseriaceae bacterium]